MQKNCLKCQSEFEITSDDLEFYDRVSPVISAKSGSASGGAGKKYLIPEPTLCPECRERRREVWRNERFMYRRQCDLCQKKIIAMYSPECKFPIYCSDCFWGDEWNPFEYGQDYDFDRPFFEQFRDLYDKVPQLSVFQTNCINSDYVLNSIYNKNCYLISGGDYNENSMYGINTQRSKNCLDHYLLYDSELCYGCLDSSRLFNCIGCQECESCSDSWFLYDCKSCKHCAFSFNLRNKEYVLFNKQLTKEEYEKQFEKFREQLFNRKDWFTDTLKKVRLNAIHQAVNVINCENCLGNNIRDSKNTLHSYDVENLEDCKYCIHSIDAKDCYDMTSSGWGARYFYEVLSSGATGQNVLFSASVINCSDIFYSRCLWNSQHCFGCSSLHNHNKYVILNQQYTQEEYENLVPRIIEHMIETKEYGEYFPASLSPFEYNRSMVIDYMPLKREDALRMGFRWFDEEEKIGETPETAVGEALICEKCSSLYRVISQESEFYKKMDLPEPKICWPCRLRNMISLRMPRNLWERECMKCGKKVQTSYSPDRAEKILCEKCYLKEVY